MVMGRSRLTIGRVMIAVAVLALILSLIVAVPPAIDPLLEDRGVRLGEFSYLGLVMFVTCSVAVPTIVGGSLLADAFSRWKASR